MPLSLITTQSTTGLGVLAGRALDVQRFRPNLVIDAHGGNAFPEDEWTGCSLCVGDALVRVDARDQRCVVVNVDPTTADRDPIILHMIARAARHASVSTARRSDPVG